MVVEVVGANATDPTAESSGVLHINRGIGCDGSNTRLSTEGPAQTAGFHSPSCSTLPRKSSLFQFHMSPTIFPSSFVFFWDPHKILVPSEPVAEQWAENTERNCCSEMERLKTSLLECVGCTMDCVGRGTQIDGAVSGKEPFKLLALEKSSNLRSLSSSVRLSGHIAPKRKLPMGDSGKTGSHSHHEDR